VGPINPVGYNHDQWAIFDVDAYSRAVWMDTFPTKGGASTALAAWISKQESNGVKIRRVRLDNGTEYGGSALKAFCDLRNITLELTAPYSPEQNGLAEAIQRLITSRARRMAIGSGIPAQYWPEICRTAVYLHNRTPSSALGGQSPIQKLAVGLGGDPPALNTGYLRAFGCRVYVHRPQEVRVQSEKLSPRALEGVLLGYEGENGHIYRVYVPGKGVVRSRDVTFDETLFPELPEGSDGADESIAEMPWLGIPVVRRTEAPTERDIPEGAGSIENTTGSPVTPVKERPDGGIYADSLPRVTEVPPQQEEPIEEVIEEAIEEETRTDTLPLRRSDRSTAGVPPGRFGSVPIGQSALLCMVGIIDDTPRTFAEAQASPESHRWQEAMRKEIEGLEAAGAWKLVPLPPDREALPGKWVYKIKLGADGAPTRYKARWCARGDRQRQGIDYQETYAAVARATSLRICMALCARHGLTCHQMDVVTAFLNGVLGPDEAVYVDQPHGFEQGEYLIVCLLIKGLYGLKQSPLLWYSRFSDYVKTVMGFKGLRGDQCLFRHPWNGAILLLYVDDLLVFAQDPALMQEVKDQLSTEFKMVDMGLAAYYLGVRIRQEGTQITLSQDAYVRQLIERHGLQNAKARKTPLSATVEKEVLEHPMPLSDPRPYQKIVGELLYLALMTRPELAFPSAWLGRVSHCPTEGHLAAAKGVLRYLIGTSAHGITYDQSAAQGPEAFCDASYAEDLTTRRSTSGFCLLLQGGLVAWKSGAQEVVATSSTEAEYIAYTSCVKELKWVQGTLGELGNAVELPTVLWTDSQGAIAIANSEGYRARTKHIDVRYHYVREEVKSGTVCLLYMPTEDMLADGLTKPLSAQLWSRYLSLIGLYRPSMTP
jgi:hypothetical protein